MTTEDYGLDEVGLSYYRDRSILVTGGAGFAGSHLVESLVDIGVRVRVPVRPTTDLAFLEAVVDRVEIVPADLFEATAVRKAVVGQDVVLHLASAKGGGIVHSMKHHGSLFRNNMLASIHVLDAARDEGVERFLMVSSACVYPRDCGIPTPEEDGTRGEPEPTNAGYGWSKRMVEFMTLAYAEEFSMNVGIVRPFNLYGPRDDFFRPTNHVIPGMITRLFNGERPFTVWGSGRQTRSFLFVEDMVRGVLIAGARPDVRGPLNLGNDEEITIADLASLIIELSGLEVDMVLDSTRPDGQPRRACDSTRALAELGFEAPTSLRQGLQKTIEWYRRARETVT